MRNIIFITVITSIIIIGGFFTGQPVFAFPASHPAPQDIPPLPIPEPVDQGPAEPPGPTEIPTPTPCIPNWCFVAETECCFNPACVFLGETNKGSQSRCDTSSKNLKFMAQSPSKSLSIFSRIGLFIQSFFRK